jgi:hypothetical protein
VVHALNKWLSARAGSLAQRCGSLLLFPSSTITGVVQDIQKHVSKTECGWVCGRSIQAQVSSCNDKHIVRDTVVQVRHVGVNAEGPKECYPCCDLSHVSLPQQFIERNRPAVMSMEEALAIVKQQDR